MSAWSNYVREESKRVEAGDYRVEITAVEEKQSRAGNAMLVISLKLNGTDITVKDYIVDNEYRNRNLTEFFDSFNIEDGDMNTLTWVGAVGAARFVEDENGYLKKKFYIHKGKQDKLPEWVGPMPERQTVATFEELDEDDDLPFN